MCDVYTPYKCAYSHRLLVRHHFFLILALRGVFGRLHCTSAPLEMGRTGNGGGNGKVMLTFDDAVTGRRRNGSLSSYLDISRDAAAGGRAAPRPLPAPAMGSRRRTYADGELDVFAAERYFKGAMDGDGDRKDGIMGVDIATHAAAAVETAAAAWPAEATRAVVIAKPPSTRASTASLAASSESSANSQTALFRGGRHRRRSSSRDKKCCVQVGVLMRTCSGKRSVRVDGGAAKQEQVPNTAEPAAAAASRVDWYRELRMQKAALGYAGDGGNSHGLVVAAAGLPPSLNLCTAKVAAIGREVATTPTREVKEKAAELIMQPSSMSRSFTLVAPVRANNVPAVASGRVVGDPGGGGGVGGGDGGSDEDAGSESSSDLFEIKSLMIEDCPYEPSEASVQWSVVTADASSERGDRVVSARWVSGGGGRAPVPVAGRPPRDHRPGGLLAGCASHRAVDVSAAATKAVPVPNAAAAQRRSEGFRKARNGG